MDHSTDARTETEDNTISAVEDRLESMEETVVQIAELVAAHLRACPGASEDERSEADARAARWAEGGLR